MKKRKPSKRVLILGSSIIFFSLFLLSEAISSYTIYNIPRAAKLFYSPPSIDPSQFQSYLKVRDPILGWPRLDGEGPFRFDSLGARPDPTFPDVKNPCISVYGDSFAYGEEVDHEEAWAHQLSQQLSCRVANYGVPGYGTDQAFLRFQKNTHDTAPLIILGIYQENILRIVNQYRYLLSKGDFLSFKPRFILENDTLQLISIPVMPESNLESLLSNPGKVFENEWFLPGSDSGPASIRFPYSFSVAKSLLSQRVQNGLLGKPNWLEFYSETHPSGAYPLLVKIISSFSEEVHRRHSKFKVIIFPSTAGYQYRERTGENPTKHLSDTLTSMNIDFIDLSSEFPSSLRGDAYCDLLTNQGRYCSGHYNANGNRMVSKIVAKWLQPRTHLVHSTGKLKSKNAPLYTEASQLP